MKKIMILFAFALMSCAEVIGVSAEAGIPDGLYVDYNEDYSELLENDTYLQKVEVTGIHAIEQKISSGYACIEMLAKWQNKLITEDSIVALGKDTIVFGFQFHKEVAAQFPEWEIKRFINIPDAEVLKKIHASLKEGFPVPVEFSLEKRILFSIVTSMDLENDIIITQDPRGYEKEYSLQEFLNALRKSEDKPDYYCSGESCSDRREDDSVRKKNIYIITAR